jgi:hypothetical protein
MEEKTVEIPVNLQNIGINKITVSDAPQLFRNVFVQEGGTVSSESNPILDRIKENTLKLSMVLVFLVFAGMLFYVRKKLKGETSANIPSQKIESEPTKTSISGMKDKLTIKMKELTQKMKNIIKKKPRS